MVRGLSEAEARELRERFGPNEPVLVARSSLVAQILRRFVSPLVLVLLVASAASAALGDVTNAAIIWAIVAASVTLELVQTRRSERMADALREQVSPTATALRDGTFREIPRRDVVRGDAVALRAGDLVPADGWLAEVKDLHVNEAALTGESLPVEKEAAPGEIAAPADLHDRRFVFLGTSVVSGTGTAVVTATGAATAFGAVAHALARRPPRTEFEAGIARFGVLILKTVVALVLFVVAVNLALHRGTLETLLFAVALAVGLTPEFLPMITTVTLARGARRMAKARVIVKNLAAIQNFGSIDVLCCDKTGTLTTGHLALDAHVDARGAEAERPLLFASVNSYFESGIADPADAAVLRKARVDPIDAAVLEHPHPAITGFSKIDEIPFDFERRRVSVVVEREGERLLVTKGAPEDVLAMCAAVEVDGAPTPLTDELRAEAEATHRALAAEGRRVLGVAVKTLRGETSFTKGDERDATLVGFLGLSDAPRPGVGEVVAALQAAGVAVKVLTGDGEIVAARVCEAVGMRSPRVVLGADIERMSAPALAQQAERTDVFARVSPAQKDRIIHALKSRGHVVGYLGDGINDAPSLHSADVGISVAGATDVAKDAASIILQEPDLGALLAGIVEGRRAFGNVMKYVLMGTSSNFGNVFSMAAAAVLLPFLPMLPTQILLNGFLYDVAQLTIPTDRVDDAFAAKPRRYDLALIRRFMLWLGPLSSAYDLLTFYVLLRVFEAPERLFHTGWFVESLATQTLVIFVIRTQGSVLSSRPSRALAVTAVAVVAVGVALPYTPVAPALGFVPLPAPYFAFLAVAVATYLGLVELVKRRLFRGALA